MESGRRNPVLPPRPLLEMMLRAREGRGVYAVGEGELGAVIEPAEEVIRWLRREAEVHSDLVKYLREEVPVECREYALNRVVDAARDVLYRTLEPWRIGDRWSQFERYAARVVAVVCWSYVQLNDDPCNPSAEWAGIVL